jgi:hypothetical protein
MLIKIGMFRQIFVKITNIKFTENPLAEFALSRAGRQYDEQKICGS